MKNHTGIVSWILSAAVSMMAASANYQEKHQRSGKVRRSKIGLPTGYSGAKMARVAKEGMLTRRGRRLAGSAG